MSELFDLAGGYREDMVSFCQRMIRTPSLPGQEGDMAELVKEEMERLDYDEVWVDRVGNVIGVVGEGRTRSIMFNSHLDHVDPGDLNKWPFPPYKGVEKDGRIWGRGASDLKGALAVQVYSAAALKKFRPDFEGKVYVAAVVMEETGGVGTMNLIKEVKVDAAIVGEATSNQIAIGHRGRVEIIVQAKGKSAHASAPSRGINPHYPLARFLCKLDEVKMTEDELFGSSTVAPTLYSCDQKSTNVIPSECSLYLDWRNVPGDTPEQILAKLQPLLEESLIGEEEATLYIPVHQRRTYTGLTFEVPAIFPSFALNPDHPLIVTSKAALEETLKREVDIIKWNFATDGGHLMAAGIPTIGFSPCEEHLTHTVNDSVGIDKMVSALAGYVAIALRWGES